MSEPATISSAQVPDVDDVRRWMQEMIKSLRFGELVLAVVAFVVRMRDLNTELTKRLADLRRGRPRSETLRRVENQLALNFAAVTIPVVYEEDEDDSSSASASASATADAPSPSGGPPREKKKRPAHRGRPALPDHLERVTESNDVPPEMRQCPLCGEQMRRVSHSICEILDVRPAELIVRRRLDERVACRNDDTIVSSPKPPQLVERGKLGATLAGRQVPRAPAGGKAVPPVVTHRRDVAPQTLGRSIAAAIDALSPVARAIQKLTSGPGLLATDATGIPVLDRDAPEGIRQGTIWCWTNAYWVSFVYSAKGDSDSVRRFLGKDYQRRVQCDGTSITTFTRSKLTTGRPFPRRTQRPWSSCHSMSSGPKQLFSCASVL